jgi:DNA recombination protein Rad52
MTDWASISKELRKPLDSRNVKPPKKFGPKGSYIEAWHAQDEANRIFTHGGWSQEIMQSECVMQSEREIGQNKDPGWGVTYTARVRITVDGVVREDFGAGHGYDRDLGLAHESAIKEAVSDAMKRALKSFGYPFGLALYDKDQANVVDGAEAERIDAAKEAYEDLFVQLQETDDMALDGFGASHAAKINSLKGTEYFEKIKGDVSGRKAKREPQENAA